MASREGEKWLDSGENGVSEFGHHKYICAANIDMGVIGINIIDIIDVD